MISLRTFSQKYRWALIGSLLVGCLMVAPQLIFRWQMGDQWRGIYLLETDSEDVYMGRVQEIIDGHPLLGAMPYFEYKDQFPLTPPTALEIVLAGTARVFDVSVATILLISKFILPAILFFLVYIFTLRLVDRHADDRDGVLVALAAASAVVLAYDLTRITSLAHIAQSSAFILWSRPVNPVFGALLLMVFVPILWRTRSVDRIDRTAVVVGGLLFAMMMASYFFSWGFALSVVATWMLLQWFSGRRASAYTAAAMIVLGIFIASPYLYVVYQSHQNVWFNLAATKQGLFHTHAPMFNSILFIVGVALAAAALTRKDLYKEDFWRFSVAIVLGGFVALNQQIITGATVWPFHFAQYTKSFSALILITLLFYVLRPRFPAIFRITMIGALLLSWMFGIATQVSVYRNSYDRYAARERYGDVFEWLNEHTVKDCVVLPQENDDVATFMYWVPAFTHCNSAVNRDNHFLIPFDRIMHDFLVILRMRGVSAQNTHSYLADNKGWVIGHFYGPQANHAVTSGYRAMQERDNILATVEKEYTEFLKKDFLAEVKRYRIDYVIADGALRADLVRALHLQLPIANPGGVAIYKIQ